MKISNSIRKAYTETISYLYIVLFVYAAVSKLLDFENFGIQLAQSPLISAFAGSVAYGILLLELSLAVCLCIPSLRYIALQASYTLMIMFSSYIVIIMHFSAYVPCSCGGILEKMSWGQHLAFNSIISLLGAVALVVLPGKIPIRTKMIHLVINSIISISTIVVLYFLSEDVMHRRNNFTRRFPHHPAAFHADIDLGNSSYYLAGATAGKVYLGDFNDPLWVMEVDVITKSKQVHRITVDDPGRQYKTVKLQVIPPFFYLSDGRESFSYKGAIKDWKATLWMDKSFYFSTLLPIDSCTAVIKAFNANNENVLGMVRLQKTLQVSLKEGILKKQKDGVFDTEGKLLYNDANKKIIYLYTYRNTYIVTDTNLGNVATGNTIDTTTTLPIETKYVKRLKARKLASPAIIVNKDAVTYKDYLFVNAGLMGQHEPRDMWEEASIIDTYDFMQKRYMFSFYLYNKKGKKISNFLISAGKVYTLSGSILTIYNLDPIAFERNR